MSWAETGRAILQQLATVEDIGPIFEGDLHIRDESRLKSLFRRVTGQQRDELVGWRVIRDTVSENWWSTARTKATERYVIRGIQGVTQRDSEAVFQARLDRVWAAFRGITSIGSARVLEAANTPGVAYVQFGSAMCHYAEIVLEVEELYTIGSVSQPAAESNDASNREDFAATANQIAGYIASVADSGRVLPSRPWVVTERDRDSLLIVPGDTPTAPGKLRSWKVYRDHDREARQLGNRIEADSSWKLACHWGWSDEHRSYDAFQQHLDAVRAVVRGVGNLGSSRNVTQVLSSPLQIREIGARMYASVLCHLAACEIAVEEVVHA